MPTPTNNPAPHAGEKEPAAIPTDGETPGMAAPPQQSGHGDTTSDGDSDGSSQGVAIPDADVEPAPDGQLPKPDLFKEGFPRK